MRGIDTVMLINNVCKDTVRLMFQADQTDCQKLSVMVVMTNLKYNSNFLFVLSNNKYDMVYSFPDKQRKNLRFIPNL